MALQPYPTLISSDPKDLMAAINQIARIRQQDIGQNNSSTTSMQNIGTTGCISCSATGTNTIALTQKANQQKVSGYINYQQFSFVAANNSTGNITVNVNAIGALNLYIADGSTQAGNGIISAGALYIISYNSALNNGAGGFQIISGALTGTSQHAFLTSGTSWTSPSNALASTVFKITVVGAGGGGGGGNTTGWSAAGGGGGAAAIYYTTLTANTAYTYAIGAGGAGGAGGGTNDGSLGGDSSITIGATTVTAHGGSIGKGSSNAANGINQSGTSATNGTINIQGTPGQGGFGDGTGSHSGGGNGGNSIMGAGGYGTTSGGGGNGGNYGGGGGGGGGNNGGGSGAQGCILIEWTL